MPYKIKSYTIPFVTELTLDQFVSFNTATNDLERLQAIGIDLSGVDNSEASQTLVSRLIGFIDELQSDITELLKKPVNAEEHITVLGYNVKLNKRLGELPYWPMTKVKAIIKSMGTDAFNKYDAYRELVGHYLYTKVTKLPYDEYKAEDFATEAIGKMLFTEVLKLGDFFLYTQHLIWMPKSDYLQVSRAKKKKKPVSKNLLNLVN